MRYRRIEPLSEREHSLGRSELAGLIELWSLRSAELDATGARSPYLERLVREVSIETGLIERLYVWDRGLTETLIEVGIDAAIIRSGSGLDASSAQRAAARIEDQRQALEGVFELVKAERPLSEHFIRGLHEVLTRNQPTTEAQTGSRPLVELELIRGRYKQHPNNPRRADGSVHEYCPPELTKEQMERLLAWYGELDESVPVDVKAAWLHHRFTQIHPFQDGNGRIARLLASLVFLRAGGMPLVLRLSDRPQYIERLEAADGGDLSPLVELFGARQSETLRNALGDPGAARKDVAAILTDVERKLRSKGGVPSEVHKVSGIAQTILSRTGSRLARLSEEVRQTLQRSSPSQAGRSNVWQSAWPAGSSEPVRFARPVREVAEKLGYEPDTEAYHSLATLSIRVGPGAEFLFGVAFHALARVEGVLAATAFTMRSLDPFAPDASTRAASDSPFVFTFKDDPEAVARRQGEWLEAAAARAMERWMGTL